jgi:hypothetical protein
MKSGVFLHAHLCGCVSIPGFAVGGVLRRVRSKRALYFRLHKEMQDANIKLKGLQQVGNFIPAVNSFCICTIFNGTCAFPGFSAVH